MLRLSNATGALLQRLHAASRVSAPPADVTAVLAQFLRDLVPAVLPVAASDGGCVAADDDAAGGTGAVESGRASSSSLPPAGSGGRAPQDFIRDVLDARWRPVATEPQPLDRSDALRCGGFTPQGCPGTTTGGHRAPVPLDASVLAEVADCVREVTAIFDRTLPVLRRAAREPQASSQRGDPWLTAHAVAVRELLLADFMESIALVMFRAQACYFLQCVAAVDVAWSTAGTSVSSLKQ